MKRIITLSIIASITLFTGCGGGSSSSTTEVSTSSNMEESSTPPEDGMVESDSSSTSSIIPALKKGFFIDSAVEGLGYIRSSGTKGLTKADGSFLYVEGESIGFFIGKLSFGTAKPQTNGLVTPKILAKGDKKVETLILRTLQSLDSDNNTSNGILIDENLTIELENLDTSVNIETLDEKNLLLLDGSLQQEIDINDDGIIDVEEEEALLHYESSIQAFENNTTIIEIETNDSVETLEENLSLDNNRTILDESNNSEREDLTPTLIVEENNENSSEIISSVTENTEVEHQAESEASDANGIVNDDEINNSSNENSETNNIREATEEENSNNNNDSDETRDENSNSNSSNIEASSDEDIVNNNETDIENNRNEESEESDENENENDENESDDVKNNETPTSVVDNNVTINANNKYMLTAWNDLGMHCMDGNDFSVFSVLPPYNNLHAQLKDKSGRLVTTGVTMTYEAIKGTDGKWNTHSVTASNGKSKTNFWNYTSDLFGASVAENLGLTGNSMASKIPEPMSFNATHEWWEAEGIPITPYNDDGSKNYYPLVRVKAVSSNGEVLASVDTVLPVSDEMDCKRCHASNSVASAKPTAGWVENKDAQKDYKYNILRLHDELQPSAVSSNRAFLEAKGFKYNSDGLEATAKGGTAILCVACHKSNALPNVGIEIKSFTEAIHSRHANVTDPKTGMKLNDSKNRTACYVCHPGAETECLRGAMGDAKNADGTSQMQCQSCHGNMKAVGKSGREGWLDQPNCQACHFDGKREVSAIDPRTNTLRNALDTRFATNTDTPMLGKSLYRFSTGHGDLQCEACHGSTHAIYPAHEADNKVSMAIQGHTGTIAECKSCHTKVPNTTTGGPHGMHPVGQSWVRGHERVAERNSAQCKACHGNDYRGSALSKTWMDRSFSTEWGRKNFSKGHKISCYDCHNGPDGDD